MAVTFGAYATIHGATSEELEREITELEALDAIYPAFTTLWVSDHPHRAALEALTSATFLATRFPRFTVGTLVLGQSYRNPGLLAKMGASLQALSHGRFIMGLGAGWSEDDYRAFNYEFPRTGVRVAQLAETIEVLHAMWAASPATYQGQYYRVQNAISAPLPDPPIPILVGTNGQKAMQVAARLADIWIWDMNDRFPGLLDHVRRSCEEYGRDPDTLRIFTEATITFPDNAADFAPHEEFDFYPHAGQANFLGPTPKAAVEQVKPYLDMGVSHIIVGGDLATIRRFADEVVPAFA
jgi:alkanesulfonate monooxygenase SsuD/methylene tetrahydromethanopterin reductase-like flavin-dependent oxidoreductase (luciferase family)